jgi:hypothetical protein
MGGGPAGRAPGLGGAGDRGGARGGTGGTGGGAGGTDAGPPSGAGGGTTACKPLGAIPRRLWRLSAEQWGNAVQSLLNLPSPPALISRGGEATYAFFSDATLGVDDSMLYAIYNVLDGATTQIDPMVGTTIASCIGTTPEAQTACATAFVQSFAAQAYRRPITADELVDLMTVFQDGVADGYSAGIELVMKAVLASPSFLFRTELGPTTLTADANGNYPDTTLTPYEIASQLSFTLLGNLPDAALTAAAADGSLATKAGIAAQVDRLMGVPAAQAYLTDTVLRWFGIELVFAKTKDAALVSEQDWPAVQSDLWTSAQQFVSSVLWSGSGKIDDLLTSPTVYVNQRLAKLYPDAIPAATPPSDGTFVAATWPASEGRSGLLTQPSYLWAQSDPTATSIVKRGKAIHDNFVCQDPVGSPVDLSAPDAVNVINCKSPDGKQMSTCDSEILKSDARIAYQPCEACHTQIDPYARVLQNFGAIGNYRMLDEAGRAIDPVATFVPTGPPVLIPGEPDGLTVPGSPLAPRMVTGAQGLASALIATRVLDGCAVQQFVGAATGTGIWKYDTCELAPIRSANDGTIKSLLTNILLADFLRARAGGPK